MWKEAARRLGRWRRLLYRRRESAKLRRESVSLAGGWRKKSKITKLHVTVLKDNREREYQRSEWPSLARAHLQTLYRVDKPVEEELNAISDDLRRELVANGQ
eukprot:5147175-Karenia_brevis.AAC.1